MIYLLTFRNSFGIFRLTDPPGLDVISNCTKTPAFHPHPDLPIYTVSTFKKRGTYILSIANMLSLSVGCR